MGNGEGSHSIPLSEAIDPSPNTCHRVESLPDPSYQAHADTDNSYPTLDFGIDPLTILTRADPGSAIPIDNAWLENFLAYDFNNDFSSVAATQGMGMGTGMGQPGGQAGMGGQLQSGNMSYARQTAYNPPSTSSSGMGDGGSRGKSKAKFRVPYFR